MVFVIIYVIPSLTCLKRHLLDRAILPERCLEQLKANLIRYSVEVQSLRLELYPIRDDLSIMLEDWNKMRMTYLVSTAGLVVRRAHNEKVTNLRRQQLAKYEHLPKIKKAQRWQISSPVLSNVAGKCRIGHLVALCANTTLCLAVVLLYLRACKNDWSLSALRVTLAELVTLYTIEAGDRYSSDPNGELGFQRPPTHCSGITEGVLFYGVLTRFLSPTPPRGTLTNANNVCKTGSPYVQAS